jgi:broad specificity phosphatase PhoE
MTSNSPATLLLVRHGHVADNTRGDAARLCGWADPPLTPLGRAQATRVAAHLAAARCSDALYTSPSARAHETATAIGHRLGLRPRLRLALREIHCGRLEGRLLADVRRDHPELWARNLAQEDDDFRWPGGESYRAFRARVLAGLGRIAAAHPGQRVVVVTHTGVITQALGALGGTAAARWEAYRAGNASLTEVRWPAGGAPGRRGTLVRFDERAHLATRGPDTRSPAHPVAAAGRTIAGRAAGAHRRQTASARRSTRRWSRADRAASARARAGAPPQPSATVR